MSVHRCLQCQSDNKYRKKGDDKVAETKIDFKRLHKKQRLENTSNVSVSLKHYIIYKVIWVV